MDATNYVLWELGQPLHAYDYETVADGTIVVRRARAGERFTTLDGQERALGPDQPRTLESVTRLALLYASGVARDEMRAGKAQILGTLAADMRALELREGASYPLYEQWIAEGLNNARLASVSTYFDCVPGFARLLAQAGDDLARFYAAARELARQPRALRHARLCTEPPGQTG